MRKLMFLLLLLSATSVSFAQKIKAYEYWVDDGYATKVSTAVEPVQIFRLQAEFSLSSVSNGLHVFNIRFADSTNCWSGVLTQYFIKAPPSIFATNQIVACEYWVDDNYMAKFTQAITPAAIIQLNDSLNVSSVSNGIHLLHIRFRDNLGSWSSDLTQYFIKAPPSFTADRQIVACEYWVDDNYMAKFTQAITPAAIIQLNDSLDVSSVSNGIHILHIRFRDNRGSWSSDITQYFIKAPSSNTGNRQVAACEYWVDDDYASKVVQDITPAGVVQLTENLNLSAVTYGFHILHIRFRDNRGSWSNDLAQYFIKNKELLIVPNTMVSCRFWYDEDLSTMETIQLQPSASVYHFADSIETPFLSIGEHIFNYQFKDTAQMYSSVRSDTLLVTSCLPHGGRNITGLVSVCNGQTGVEYSIRKIKNATTYTWTVPEGATIVSGDNSYSIVVNYSDTAITGDVKVFASNSCGDGPLMVLPVTVHLLPVPAISGLAELCSSTQNLFSTEEGMTDYLWTVSPDGAILSGATSQAAMATWNSAGSQWIKVSYTDIYGCAAASPTQYDITVNPLPTAATGGDKVICLGNSTSIGAAAVSGNTYSWVSNPAGFSSTSANPTVTPTVTTTYTLTETITATGCIKSNSLTVTVNPVPIATTGGDKVICLGNSTSIGAAAVSGNTYSWVSNPVGFASTSANPTVAPTLTTTYTLTETITATGCTKSNSLTVTVNPLPTAPTGGNKAICFGNSTSIGAAAVSGNTYSWVSNPAGWTSTSANPTVAPMVTTTYTLTETITATGCTKSNSLTVTVNPLPTATTGGDKVICFGNSTSIGAAAVSGNTYSWVSNPVGWTSTSANPTVAPTITTTYTLTETITATGCTKSNSLTVTVNPLPEATTGGNKVICLGNSISIGAAAVSGNTYSWVSFPAGYASTLANPTVAPTLTTTYTLTETITATGCIKSNSLTVTVNPLPTATTGGVKAICFGNSTSIGAAAVSGNTYSWVSNPAGWTSTSANPTVAPMVTTTYTLTETITSTGCVKSNSLTVTVNPLPTATTGGDKVICFGNSASIGADAVSGNTYSWVSNPAGFSSTSANPTVTPTVTTTYTLTETITATGCTKSNSLMVTVNPLPEAATGGDKAICFGNSTTIGAAAVSGNTYAWVSNPVGFASTSANSTVTPTVTTTYTLTETITATGCVKSNSLTVTVNPLPIATTGGDKAICLGNSTSIGATAVSGNTYSWVSNPAGWTSTSANPTVAPMVTTTYTLTETITATGCTKSNSLTVTVNPLPTATTGGDKVICFGNSTSIGAAAVSGNTYSWFSNPVGYTSNVANPAVTPTSTTVYTLTETITATGCTKSNSMIVTVNPLPTASTGSDKAICFGNSTSIGATAVSGNTYSWVSNPAGFVSALANPTVTPEVTTTYTLTETITATGCTKSNSMVVTVNPLPEATTGGDKAICFGNSTSIGATEVSGNTYSWFSNPVGFASTSASPTVAPTATTTYTLTETITATGCAKSNSLIVTVNPLPTATTGGDKAICFGNSTSIGAAAVSGNTYSWSSNPVGFSSTSANPTVAPIVTTTYTVTETITATGCTKSNSLTVTVNPLPTATTGGDKAICFGNSTSIGSAAVSGNTYGWVSNPVGFTSALANPTVAPMVTTTYTLTETITATGCTKSNSLIVTVNPLPTATTGGDKAICFGNSTSIGAAAVSGNTYSWFANPAGFASTSANPTVAPTLTTTYTLTETITATGCTKSNSLIVTVNPLPTATTGGDKAICFGDSTTIGAAAVSGNTYSWVSNPAGFTSNVANPTVAPTVTTTYTIAETITATGCIKSNSLTVTVNPLPTATTGGDKAICFGNSTIIGAAAVSGNTYNWVSNPAGFSSTSANPTVAPTGTTSYTLSETITATGCTKSNNLTVTVNPLPTAATGGDKAICLGNSTSIGATAVSGNTYSWVSNPAGFTSNVANPTVAPTLTTTYTLTETITATGCTKSNSMIVTVNPLPTATTGGDKAICFGNSTSIGAAAVSGNTYSWFANPAGFASTSANPTVTPTSTTVYTLTETITATGCTKSNYLIVTVNPLPTATTGGDKAICFGNSTSIGSAAVSGNTYGWVSIPVGFASALANPTVAPMVTTTYTLTETITATGCTKSNSLIVTVNPLPTATTGGDKAICFGNSTSIGASAVSGNTYSWVSNPAGYASTLANPTVAPTLTTTYTLTETITATGCIKSNSLTVTVNPLPTATAGGDKAICFGNSTSIGAAAVSGNTYSWVSNPAGWTSTSANPTVAPMVTTTYTLTETITSTGCVKSNSLTVTVNPLPTATTGGDKVICLGNSTSIGTAAVSGNTYSWVSNPVGFSSTSPNPTVAPTLTTTYTLTETITATGCAKSNSLIVTVNPLPTATTGGDKAICFGNSTSIGAAAVSGNMYSWVSSPAGYASISANPTVTPEVTTTYTLTETITATGCVKSNSLTVTINPLPTATTGGDKVICFGNSTSIGVVSVSGNTYSWVSNPAGFISALANPTVTPEVTTTYTLTETITATGCTKSNSLIVTVNPLPTATTGGDKAICFGNSTSIGASAVSGNTYSWVSNPAGFTSTSANPTVTPTVTTTYTLTETITATGCAKSNSLIVTVNPLPTPSIVGQESVCAGTTETYTTESGMTSYNWTIIPLSGAIVSGSSTNQLSVTWNVSGVRTILVSYVNANGCSPATATIKTVTINPLVAAAGNITGFATVYQGQTNVEYSVMPILNASSYVWELPSGVLGTSSTNVINLSFPNTALSGNIMVKGHNGCGDGLASSLQIEVFKHSEINLLLEGLYSSETGVMNKSQDANGDHFSSDIADKIDLELRNPNFPYAIAFSANALDLKTDGTCSFSLPSAFNNSYYIVVKHRNHIETWSKNPVSCSGEILTFDFRTSATKAFGDNLKMVSTGVYALYAGDVDNNGFIDGMDINTIQSNSSIFATGYITPDVNGDGIMDALDLIITDNNAAKFISVMKP